MQNFRVIAKRVSYEELFIEAESASQAIELITMGNEEYEFKDLDGIYWDIESVEGV